MLPSSVTLTEMLDARERRANAQSAMLASADASYCLVSFSLNIAGDVKRTAKTRLLFDRGLRAFDLLGFPEVERRVIDEKTGTEALILLRADAADVKAATERLENAFPAARLYDFDVLNAQGEKLSRNVPRKCLVCDGPAAVCARSRAHGLDAVKAATDALLSDFCADTLAYTAHFALERELLTTPKPGLVDGNNNGAHTDMDVPLFLKSAAALVPYFKTAVLLGLADAGMAPLKQAGLGAERTMFAATNGVNTHKGMIYSTGLLLYGMGKALSEGGDAVAYASGLARTDAEERLDHALAERDTNGAKVFSDYGARGAVGEAADGFFHACYCADRLAAHREAENPGALALCDVMVVLNDTNLLHRGGGKGLAFVQRRAKEIAALPESERAEALVRLDAELIERNLSPGGAADMLALGYLLDAWRTLSRDLREVRV
ncbi:MAG: citrate lyase holo-[Clostridia bacterium]|nr:citrate lyase holo-[acyl-carrier protein] synthase [Clostridia bacterium]